jgi:hypothetical protein
MRRLAPDVLAELVASYRTASKADKGRLLDAFSAQTGFHRKHAMRVLRQGRRPRQRRFDESVRDALATVWRATGQPGSKRLQDLLPAVPRLLPADPVLRGRVLSMSRASIDRALAAARAEERLMRLCEALPDLGSVGRTLAELDPAERRELEARYANLVAQVEAMVARAVPQANAPET